jgi:hypothetical protein
MPRESRQDKPWTDADIAQVRKRWNDSTASAGEIGREMGRTRNSICGLIHRLRDQFDDRSQMAPRLRAKTVKVDKAPRPVREPAWSPDDIAMAERMWRAKMPIREIGDRLGKSYDVVNSFVNKNRERFPHRYKTGAGIGESGRQSVARVTQAVAVRTGGQASKAVATTDALFTGIGISLVDLTSHSCRFPVSGEKAAMLFCGAATSHGRVFQARAADTRGAAT